MRREFGFTGFGIGNPRPAPSAAPALPPGPFGTDDTFDNAGAWTVVDINPLGGGMTVADGVLNYISRNEFRCEQDIGFVLPTLVDVSFDWTNSAHNSIVFKVYLGGIIHAVYTSDQFVLSGNYSGQLAAGTDDNKRGIQISASLSGRSATVDNFVTSG